jgi:hypothetical protein
MGFKHTGLFPEQAVNWDFMINKIKNSGRKIKVLNLFAYTGGATVACAVLVKELSCGIHTDFDNKAVGIIYIIKFEVLRAGGYRYPQYSFTFSFTTDETDYFNNQKKEADKVNYSYDFKEFGEFADPLNYSEICDVYNHTADIVDKCIETIVNNGNNGASYTIESVYEELWSSFNDDSEYYAGVLVTPSGIRTYMDTDLAPGLSGIRVINYGNIYAYKDVMYAANINMRSQTFDTYTEIIIVVYVHSFCKAWSLKIRRV